MKVYCPSCGAAVHYSGEKPKFCSTCANPISIYAKTKPQRKKTQKNYEFSEDIDIDKDPSEFVPKIRALDVDISNAKVQRNTIGQILESQPSKAPPESNDQFISMDTNQTKEEFLKDFQKEAGSLRPNQKDA